MISNLNGGRHFARCLLKPAPGPRSSIGRWF